MEAKHTPGPWHIGMRGGANSNLIYAYNGVDQHHDTPICSVYGMYQHCDVNEQKDNEGLANARLIAAAPELLEALKIMHQHVLELCLTHGMPLPEASIEKSSTAIRKATE